MSTPVLKKQAHSPSLVAIAGFPKSGNTLINETLNYAGHLADSSWTAPKYEYQGKKDLAQFTGHSLSSNPFLGQDRCHLKTHLIYSHENYRWEQPESSIESIVVIIRNPFDTLLSSTNYLRFSAALNNRLTANQISTLKHFYPDYTENDVLNADVFNLDKLRDEGALDKALEIFSTSHTCVPQFLARSGTWLDFYKSFRGAEQPVFQVRFEDIVNSLDNWQTVSECLATFLHSDPELLAKAFALQNAQCKQAKSENNLFFPVAEANYFERYFEAKSLRRFCNRHLHDLKSIGYEDMADRIMSS
jgi:hypothetical protein